jgi:P pilus assembly chaperone PapD
MIRVISIVLSTWFGVTLITFEAAAMSVEPMLLDMSSIGKASRDSFKVTNNASKPLPVEIGISRLELGLNGEQKKQPADDEFIIYPAQAMIPPGGSQVFRVQWAGDPGIAKSQAYWFNVSQVPVKLPKETSGIQIVMSFGVTVNVAPPNGKSDLQVLSAAPVKDKDGKRFAALTVKNPGNKHAYLKQSSIHLSGGNWSADLAAGEIEQKMGLGIVQPGKERRFILPVEVPAAVSAIQATVKLKPDGR